MDANERNERPSCLPSDLPRDVDADIERVIATLKAERECARQPTASELLDKLSAISREQDTIVAVYVEGDRYVADVGGSR